MSESLEKLFNSLDYTGRFLPRNWTRKIAGVASGHTSKPDIDATLQRHSESDINVWKPLARREKASTSIDNTLDDFYTSISSEIGEDFRYSGSKLLKPNELTLTLLYEHQELTEEEAEDTADMITRALIEGDMRDAINDEEYDDFELRSESLEEKNFTQEEKKEKAERIQEAAWEQVEARLEKFPEQVREEHQKAVDISENHQRDDEEVFRPLFEETDLQGIKEKYREGEGVSSQEEIEELFTEDEQRLDYLETQFERVGVLYNGMFNMYEATGVPENGIDENFRKSIIFQIIGAQIWLDDIDDLEEDLENNQLTPVTAELLLTENSQEAYHNIIDLKNQYFDRALEYAEKSSSEMAGIATRYIEQKLSETQARETIQDNYSEKI